MSLWSLIHTIAASLVRPRLKPLTIRHNVSLTRAFQDILSLFPGYVRCQYTQDSLQLSGSTRSDNT